jgi:hypothetical protein
MVFFVLRYAQSNDIAKDPEHAMPLLRDRFNGGGENPHLIHSFIHSALKDLIVYKGYNF